jgi:hypothetical protein
MKHKIEIAITLFSVMLLLSFAGGATAQSSGPIAWWPGDGNANDVVGPNHGTLHNGAGFVAGQVGQAFSFDGVNDFVSFGNSIGNFGTSDFTVEFWIRTSAVREEVVIGKRSSCSVSSMWDSGGHAPEGPNAAQLTMAVSERPGLINHIRIFGDEWADGTFHHFAYTRQGTTLQGYRDGVKEAETITSAVANMSNSAELRASFSPCIGIDARKHLTGELDEIKLYDRALSAAEIAEAATTSITVDVDIKPGSSPNSINLGSGGTTAVAILGSANFDVITVNPDTLTLGTAGVKTVGKTARTLCSVADVSGDFSAGPEGAPDGFDDMVCHFITMDIVPEAGETTATISGELNDTTPIEGTDSVNIVP